MYVRQEDVRNCLFKDTSSLKNNKLFFSISDGYWYTRCTSFRRIFQDTVFNLQIIRPQLLQERGMPYESKHAEREKIEVMERVIKMAPLLLKDYKDVLFKGKRAPSQSLADYFYIWGEAEGVFIKEIMLPMLRLVASRDKRKWVRLNGKKGFWREMDEFETMGIGGEVSMNLTTGKKMLRL